MTSIVRRGSRKHVLDWVEQPRFLEELERLIALKSCRIPAGSLYLPRGHAAQREARLETFGRAFLPESTAWDELRRWWLRYPRGANTPNWDIAVGCEIGGRPGLVLVEAKAHVPELSSAGKTPDKPNPRRTADSQRRSRENTAQIRAAIESAGDGLRRRLPEISLSVDENYQLSNRIAFAWKLASSGVPNVLLYLGFTGDSGMRKPLKDDAEWRSLFRKRVGTLCPGGIPEIPIHVGSAEFWLLCRAKEVVEVSTTASFTPIDVRA